MANVDDHGLEVLKKAARNIGEKPKQDYILQVGLVLSDIVLSTSTTNGALESTQQEVLSELDQINSELDSQTLELNQINSELDQIRDNQTNGTQIVRQGEPNTLANAWPVKITDGMDNNIVRVPKEGDHYQVSDKGLPIYGINRDESPAKYHAIHVDARGHQSNYLIAPDGTTVDFNAGLSSAKTLRTAANAYGFDGTDLRQILTDTAGRTQVQVLGDAGVNKMKVDTAGRTSANIFGSDGTNAQAIRTDSSGRVKTQLVGNDGLYTAYVDSVGRLATNANITFPETVYIKQALRNGSSKNLNVNGATTPVNFRFTPSSFTYYIEQIALLIEDQGDFLPTNFGAIATLTNGLQINVQSKGSLFTIANMQDNADMYLLFTESNFAQSISVTLAANRESKFAAWRLQNRIALDPALGDYIEFKVRDNLTGLNNASAYVSVWRTLG